MSDKIRTIREYHRGRFVVELAEHVEYDHPAGTIATGDDVADVEYVRKIESGEYPWYTLGVHVYVTEEHCPHMREIGSSFLGWCDTYDLAAIGARDVVSEAVADARNLIESLQED